MVALVGCGGSSASNTEVVSCWSPLEQARPSLASSSTLTDTMWNQYFSQKLYWRQGRADNQVCRGLRSIKSVRINCVTTFGYEAISRSVACQKGYQRICVGCMAKGNHHWPYRCWLLLKRRGNHHIGADCMFEGHPPVWTRGHYQAGM